MALRRQPVRNPDTEMAAGLPNLSGPGSSTRVIYDEMTIYYMHSVNGSSFYSSSRNEGAYEKKGLDVKVTKETRMAFMSIFHNTEK
jgi:hypothetical protein